MLEIASILQALDVSHIIKTGGLLLVAAIIFAESGMFVGFFFPGDTLLISAGVFAAQGKLDIAILLPVVAFAAILGDNIGYLIGEKYGRHLFDKPNSVVFRQEHLHRAEAFFEKYGSKAMLLAHFVPVVRTFAPAAAGISNMPRKQFIIFDAIGDTAWAIGLTLIGYFFGSKIPNIDHYILLAVAFVMLATLGPAIYHFVQAVRKKRAA
ncbi:MAG: DedA family protein [Patescibacteria group bacterium]|nr:DedA family protein [Patescibacteria group bacterium]